MGLNDSSYVIVFKQLFPYRRKGYREGTNPDASGGSLCLGLALGLGLEEGKP